MTIAELITQLQTLQPQADTGNAKIIMNGMVYDIDSVYVWCGLVCLDVPVEQEAKARQRIMDEIEVSDIEEDQAP